MEQQVDTSIEWAADEYRHAEELLSNESLDRNRTLRRAVEMYNNALTVYTEHDTPHEWARAMTGLGNAYHELNDGFRMAMLNEAVECYKEALRVQTMESHPSEWATLHFLSATALADMESDLLDERNDYLAKAIEHYRKALKVFTQQNHPDMWAGIISGLGDAYRDYNPGDPTKSLTWAIQCYQTSLAVYNDDQHAVHRAKVYASMSVCHKRMPGANKTVNLQNAMQAMRGALRVYTEQTYPQEFADCSYEMAKLNIALASETKNTAQVLDACTWFRMAKHAYETLDDQSRISLIMQDVHKLSGEYPQLNIK